MTLQRRFMSNGRATLGLVIVAGCFGQVLGATGVPRKNFIDEHVFGKMEKDSIPHAALAPDSEFLRRVYLDLTGRIPEPAVVRAFLKDTDLNKRDRLIDSLFPPLP